MFSNICDGPVPPSKMAQLLTGGSGASAMSGSAMKLVVLYCAQAVATFSYISLLSVVGERLSERVRGELFANILRQDIAFFDVEMTGSIINRLTSDVQTFKVYIRAGGLLVAPVPRDKCLLGAHIFMGRPWLVCVRRGRGPIAT